MIWCPVRYIHKIYNASLELNAAESKVLCIEKKAFWSVNAAPLKARLVLQALEGPKFQSKVRVEHISTSPNGIIESKDL
jgi:hypothetical protein